MQIRYNSPVVLTYTLLCGGVLFANAFTGGFLIRNFFVVYPDMPFDNVFTYWRFFSHVVGHEGWSHLMGNFAFILLLGPILEEKYGSGPLLQMILVTAGITGLLNSLFFPTGLMGASGIVFMFILLSSFTNFKYGEIPLTFLLIVILFLTKEVVAALQEDKISQFAHILGGVAGSVFGFRRGR